jgi:DNA phosphorothioation-associated putative methyltransferase
MAMAKLVGKVVANTVYVLPDHISTLPIDYVELIENAKRVVEKNPPTFNVLKISSKVRQVSFLKYEDLIKSPFPELHSSVSVSIDTETISKRTYKKQTNPPILHRKELLFGEAHPEYETFTLLTRILEGFGLFGDTSRIGYKREWNELLGSVGIKINGHTVVFGSEFETNETISRHRTALVRSSLSAPIASALKYELLSSENTIFDYGCGRGDDLALLAADGLDVVGWDPYYAPDGEKRKSHIVNLGYVLNVIEVPSERVWVLQDAYKFADEILLVSALIDGQKSRTQAKRYRDGIITSRGTFQKFFTQTELRELIDASLNVESISVGPGLFFVIRDSEKREKFLRTRHKKVMHDVLPRISTYAKRFIELSSEEDHKFANAYWELTREFGRLPKSSELPPDISEWIILKFRTPKKASAWLLNYFGEEELERAAQQKKDRLLCYLALALFRRKNLRSLMTSELRREIKRTFGSLKSAEEIALQTLKSMANADILANDCMYAWEQGIAQIDAKGRLVVHAQRVYELSAALQVVVKVAEWLGEDLLSVDVVYIHVEYVTVTFCRYRNFYRDPFPVLESRLRVRLINQSVKVLPERENEPPRLFVGKGELLNLNDNQVALDLAIKTAQPEIYLSHRANISNIVRLVGQTGQTWNGIELSSFFKSFPKEQFDYCAVENRILDYAVLPSLDDPCGRYLTFRDLIECGETQKRIGIDNIPKQPESYGALIHLSTSVLDHVIDEYGMIELTYGFSSSELANKISSRIAPRIDQHAACELNKRKNPICSRLGAAVDFIVEYESMLEVAQWVAMNCEFDRLYFYWDERPIHVSAGPENNRNVVLMKQRRDGRQGPINIGVEKFIKLSVEDTI